VTANGHACSTKSGGPSLLHSSLFGRSSCFHANKVGKLDFASWEQVGHRPHVPCVVRIDPASFLLGFQISGVCSCSSRSSCVSGCFDCIYPVFILPLAIAGRSSCRPSPPGFSSSSTNNTYSSSRPSTPWYSERQYPVHCFRISL